MRFLLLPLIVWLCAIRYAGAQTDTTGPDMRGQVFGKIYADYCLELTPDDPATAFEITRAYFGYKRNLDRHFSAIVELDIGSGADVSPASGLKRYAYFKNAGVNYTNKRLSLGFGLNDTHIFKLQEGFWGYRYLYKSFMDEHKFGPAADIGFKAEYRASTWLTLDHSIMNGSGYSFPQLDNRYKYSFGLTINPLPWLISRLYYDIFVNGNPQQTYAWFLGFKGRERWNLAFEYLCQANQSFDPGHDSWGISVYGTLVIREKLQAFARYDYLESVTLPGMDFGWNIDRDGNAVIGGLQYSFNKYVRAALNYQGWIPTPLNQESDNFLYLNMEINF